MKNCLFYGSSWIFRKSKEKIEKVWKIKILKFAFKAYILAWIRNKSARNARES
jgi:hypothetical protein